MKSYDDHVKSALKQTTKGLHLDFIDPLFRTKEVCLAAIKLNVAELSSVPMGNLDYVMKDIEGLEDVYLTMKKKEQEPGYYGEFKSYQDKLNHYKATDHDDMLRKIYETIRI